MQVAKIIGGAGTGKTTRLLQIMEKVIATGRVDPHEIGFASFTRAARQEASDRAAALFGIPVEYLENDGWFKTVHSVCYRQLNPGKSLLTGEKESRNWLSEALGAEVTPASGTDNESSDPFAGKTDADVVLSMWSAARSRLWPLEKEHEITSQSDPRTPDFDYCKNLIKKYETRKRLDGRLDFVDLLGRFAGYKFGVNSHERCAPDGEIPKVPVWFLDEQQDASALLHEVCLRLVSESMWVYIVGDPFQSIYSFSGSDPRHFMNGWKTAKQDVLQQTYRCPAPVIELGERILSSCSDYWDRGIKPAPHAGEIEESLWGDLWPEDIDPTQDWLLIARTNFLAKRLATRMDAQGHPWSSTSNMGCKWNAPRKNAAYLGLMSLEDGLVISVPEWKSVLREIPAKDWLVKGTKARWLQVEKSDELADLAKLTEWGATEKLVNLIKAKAWYKLLGGNSTNFVRAVRKHGYDLVVNPKIRIGTIHSVKGAEADNVLLMTTTTQQVAAGQEFSELRRDEERRVEYVGVTRARRRLVICDEGRKKKNRMEIPV